MEDRLQTDRLRQLSLEAGFDEVDEVDLFDIVFGACECCCLQCSGGNKTC